LLVPPRPPVDDVAPPAAFDPPNATAPPLAEERPPDPLVPPDPGAEECVVVQASSPASATIRETEGKTFRAGRETNLIADIRRILQFCHGTSILHLVLGGNRLPAMLPMPQRSQALQISVKDLIIAVRYGNYSLWAATGLDYVSRSSSWARSRLAAGAREVGTVGVAAALPATTRAGVAVQRARPALAEYPQEAVASLR
jgi:hypothetical protein